MMVEATSHIIVENFEEIYLRLRQKEGRIYTDEEVLQLPKSDPSHLYYKEWQVREDSCRQLVNYLKEKKVLQEILEVGCGNGWLSAKLKTLTGSHVTGIDVNKHELQQAKRVFGKIPDLEFYECSIGDEALKSRKFDIIVFAASIQYFSSINKTLKTAIDLSKQDGEIHIIDSHFYKQNELAGAQLRSKQYFEEMGFPEMTDHYHHHSIEDLATFDHHILYKPGAIGNIFKKNKNPFQWICVKRN
jgi:ubiquinone/menaquinone biosynthesis C-methylase UbiE